MAQNALLHAQLARCVDALTVCIESLKTYGNHPLIERQVSNALDSKQAKLDAEVLRCAPVAVESINALIAASNGVYGLHDTAPWDTLDNWLEGFDKLVDAVRAAKDGE